MFVERYLGVCCPHMIRCLHNIIPQISEHLINTAVGHSILCISSTKKLTPSRVSHFLQNTVQTNWCVTRGLASIIRVLWHLPVWPGWCHHSLPRPDVVICHTRDYSVMIIVVTTWLMGAAVSLIHRGDHHRDIVTVHRKPRGPYPDSVIGAETNVTSQCDLLNLQTGKQSKTDYYEVCSCCGDTAV